MPVPDSVSLQNAALIEPFACVLNTMQKVGGVHAGQTVHIFGLGAIGLTAVMQAATSGATVVVFDPSPLRRQKALAIGASCAVDPLLGVEANLDEIEASTGRRFADLVIEASGVAAAQAASLESADHGGRVVLMGISRPRPSGARLGLVQDRDLTVTTSVGAPAAVWPVALRFVENTGLDLTPIVSSVLPFSECVEAIQRAEEPGRDIKILLRPDAAFNTTQPALTGVG
jgi:threonine dehydrogenase-like Zn-dependent dehydrogenase